MQKKYNDDYNNETGFVYTKEKPQPVYAPSTYHKQFSRESEHRWRDNFVKTYTSQSDIHFSSSSLASEAQGARWLDSSGYVQGQEESSSTINNHAT